MSQHRTQRRGGQDPQHGGGADPGRGRSRCVEQAERGEHHAEQRHRRADQATPTQRALGRGGRLLAHRRDRRDARGPAGGEVRRDQGHREADEVGQHQRARRELERAGVDVEADRSEQAGQRAGQSQADHDPDRRADQGHQRRLDEHAASYLCGAGSDRAQQRELADPLGHQDVEGVGDDEAADQDRDHCERDEEGRDHVEELADGVLRLLRHGVALDGFVGRRQHRLRGGDQLGLGDAGRSGQRSGGEDVAAVQEELLGAGGREDDQRGAGRPAAVELGGAGERQRLAHVLDRVAGGSDDRDVVAHLVAGLLGGTAVEHDVGVRLGPLSGDQAERGLVQQVRDVGVVERDGRGALATDQLSVLVEHRHAEAVDAAVGPGDLGQRLQPIHDLRGQRGRVADPELLERLRARGTDHAVRGRALDDPVEGRAQPVAEREYAGEEPDPQHDRERAHQEPDLAGQQVA